MHTFVRFCRRLPGGFALVVAFAASLCAQTTPPTIVTNPASQTINAGATVTFSVVALGTPPLSYQWYQDDLPIDGATTNLYSIAGVSLLDAASYVAVVTNALGAATSAPAVLTVVSPPLITEQPASVAVYLGQTASFSVTALSAAPVSYQWVGNGVFITNATNRIIILPKVATNDVGTYNVRVSNTNGTVISQNATLSVNPLPAAALNLGVVTTTNRIRVPVLFTANSSETNLSFSVAWDPAVYMNATFEPEIAPLAAASRIGARLALHRAVMPSALPHDTVVTNDTSQLADGRLGIALAWTGDDRLSPGQNSIGELQFDLVDGQTNAFAGMLALTNLPLPAVVAPPVDDRTAVTLNDMNPQVIFAGEIVLNRQTGYLQQPIHYSNPGRADPGNTNTENARLTVGGLGFDSNTNLIVLANAQGILLIPPIPYVDLGAVAPGEVLAAELEYYSTDRKATNVTPSFDMYWTPPVDVRIPNGQILLEAVVRQTNGLALVEFPTGALRRYYIQYATNLAGFTNGNYRTSLPHVPGTGTKRQWLDSGPPRTATFPGADGVPRFYQVLEVH